MCNNHQSEPTSGFVIPSEIAKGEGFTELTNISGRGVFLLTRAKRHGRWWMLKGLQEKYRHDSIYRAFLEKEFEIASQLQHPMVVSVYTLEEVEGLGLCIVMEWIEGTTLREWMDVGEPTRKQRRHIADMLLEALLYVHSRQTQHRDLKPSNIMVTHNGHYLKLIDFGLSDTDSHAVLKAPAGTEGYMAPEGPSDIYSLGVILRELHLGWTCSWVIRKCCAPLHTRYQDITAIQRDLHRVWHWPPRILFTVILAMLVALPYLFNLTHTRQRLQSVGDSLRAVREESNNLINAQKAKSDSVELQMKTDLSNQEREAEKTIGHLSEQLTELQSVKEDIQQHERHISEEKKRIDNQIKEMGIERILDTLSCRRYVPIPILSIFYEMINETEESELKGYIEERYKKPCLKRYYSLPFD